MLVYYCRTLIRELDLAIQRSTAVERWIEDELLTKNCKGCVETNCKACLGTRHESGLDGHPERYLELKSLTWATRHPERCLVRDEMVHLGHPPVSWPAS